MRRFAVEYAPQPLDQLAAIESYIAEASSPEAGERFVNEIVSHCDALESSPERGTARDDLLLGLRTLGFRRRVLIAYTSDRKSQTVRILGIYYGGQDYEGRLVEQQSD
ncbi:type II toxin-antitoxin system RelE/ParE family toxin [Ochrobactrum sp. 3-3]|uniref:type II toxin-antitoxin system RelE/ParE family toxin n=1 Tax=Ochrobactrum sp. 3-3 TaxID=1830124 RepID=UPI000DEF7CE8|nr:type II toxin-antitoxin system RelE/ParE family toxin [Ochrobactrum sp. 3-3]